MPSTPSDHGASDARRGDRTGAAAPQHPAPTAIAYAPRAGDRRPLQDACRRIGVELLEVVREPQRQPPAEPVALDEALAALERRHAECLVVRRLADLDPAPGRLEEVLARAEAGDLRLLVLDVGLDTATPTGRFAVGARREATAARASTEATPGPSSAPVPERTPCVGYACATRDGPARRGDLAAHRAAIEDWCAAHDATLVELVGDRAPTSGKPLNRPGLRHAIRRLGEAGASCLVVARLDHLSSSAAGLGQVVARVDALGARLVALDVALDTETEGGAATARTLARVGSWEHDRLSARTRAGLAAAEEKRRSAAGEEPAASAALWRRIHAMRADGMTLQAIADALNAERVPTQRGGSRWWPSSIQSVLARHAPPADDGKP